MAEQGPNIVGAIQVLSAYTSATVPITDEASAVKAAEQMVMIDEVARGIANADVYGDRRIRSGLITVAGALLRNLADVTGDDKQAILDEIARALAPHEE